MRFAHGSVHRAVNRIALFFSKFFTKKSYLSEALRAPQVITLRRRNGIVETSLLLCNFLCGFFCIPRPWVFSSDCAFFVSFTPKKKRFSDEANIKSSSMEREAPEKISMHLAVHQGYGWGRSFWWLSFWGVARGHSREQPPLTLCGLKLSRAVLKLWYQSATEW